MTPEKSIVMDRTEGVMNPRVMQFSENLILTLSGSFNGDGSKDQTLDEDARRNSVIGGVRTPSSRSCTGEKKV